jgi:hypothetical protein
MARWQYIGWAYYTEYLDSTGAGNDQKIVYTNVYYDKDRTTPTSTVVAFKIGCINDYWYKNGYCLLVNPGGTNETVIKLKNPNDRWSSVPTYGHGADYGELTLTKSAYSTSFTIPTFWFCNTGGVTPDYAKREITYGTTTYSLHSCFENTRAAWFTTIKSITLDDKTYFNTISNVPVAGDGGKPTLEITDNGNNTFKLSGKLGSNGANNALQSSALYYTLDGYQPAAGSPNTTVVSLGKTSGGAFTETFNIPSTCQKVIATVWCIFTYNSTQNSGGHIELPVKYYVAPSKPGIPVIKYTKNRLTVKENWTYTWKAADKVNDYSPIKGYRIRLYKNGVSIPIYNSDGKEISKDDSTMGNGRYYYDTENDSCTFSIDPVLHGFLPGDKVKLGIYAYSRNGKGETEWVVTPTYPESAASIRHSLWSGAGKATAEVLSAETLVQNAGVVQIKVGSEWKEGQVWVKANNTWHEAETVNVKAGGYWYESQ